MIVTAQPVLELSFKDASDSNSQMRLWLRNQHASVDGMRSAVTTLLETLPTDVSMRSATLRVEATDTEQREARGGSPKERFAVLIFDTLQDGQYVILAVPSVSDAMMVPGSSYELDTENAAIVGLASAAIDIGLSNPAGYAARSLIAALVEWRIL